MEMQYNPGRSGGNTYNTDSADMNLRQERIRPDLTEENTILRAQLKRYRVKQEQLQNMWEDAEQRVDELKKKLDDLHSADPQKTIKELEDKLEQVHNNDTKFHEEELHKLKLELSEARAERANADKVIASLNLKLDEANKKLQQKNSNPAAEQSEEEPIVPTLFKENCALRDQLNDCNFKRDLFRNMWDDAEQRVTELKNQLDDLQKTHGDSADYQRIIRELEDKLKQVQNNDTRFHSSEVMAEVKPAIEGNATSNNQCCNEQQHTDLCDDRAKSLQKQIESAQNYIQVLKDRNTATRETLHGDIRCLTGQLRVCEALKDRYEWEALDFEDELKKTKASYDKQLREKKNEISEIANALINAEEEKAYLRQTLKETNVDSCLAQLKEQQKEKTKIAAALRKAEKEMASLQQTLYETNVDSYLAQLNEKQKENERIAAALKRAEEEKASLQQTLEETNVDFYIVQLKEQQKEKTKIEAALIKAEKEMASLRQTLHETNVDSYLAQLKEKQKENERIAAALKRAEEEKASLQQTLEEINVDSYIVQLKEQQKEKTKIAAALIKAEEEKASLQQTLQEINVDSYIVQLKEQQKEKTKIEAALKRAEEEKASLQQTLQEINVDSYLAQLKEKQNENEKTAAALKRAEEEKASFQQTLEEKEQEWTQKETTMETKLAEIESDIKIMIDKKSKKKKRSWLARMFTQSERA
uniref:meiosis-specific nuclear structural protein 1-like n=1 Tax=Scatophagus argus TaxID=75038 RepID=UPI001ED86185|nr:meiosis-specific nuclear structural protein 1-like [Scatophagus argus]